jgi:hypothetical protein
MKPKNINWNLYINETFIDDSEDFKKEYNDWIEKNHKFQKEVFRLREKVYPYIEPMYRPVDKRSYPKRIIKEKTKSFYGSEKFPPYSFRFQCLATGKKSRLIKMIDYPKYGILPQETKNGGTYPEYEDIKNKIKPIEDYYNTQIAKIHDTYCPGIDPIYKYRYNMFWDRYNEYLGSDDWQEKRLQIIIRDNFSCLITGEKENLQVHHVTYDSVGQEHTNHLLTLSKKEHKRIHCMEPHLRRQTEVKLLSKVNGVEYNKESVWFDTFDGYRKNYLFNYRTDQ